MYFALNILNSDIDKFIKIHYLFSGFFESKSSIIHTAEGGGGI